MMEHGARIIELGTGKAESGMEMERNGFATVMFSTANLFGEFEQSRLDIL